MLVLNSQNLIVPFPYKSAHHSMIMYFATSGLIDTSQDFFYGLTVEELEYFISVANKFDRVAANASLCELHAYATGILTPEEYASWQSVCSSHPNLETLTAAYPDLNVDNKTFVMPVRHPVDRMMSILTKRLIYQRLEQNSFLG